VGGLVVGTASDRRGLPESAFFGRWPGTDRCVVVSHRRGWEGFGSYSLGGELARERPLLAIERRLTELSSDRSSLSSGSRAELDDLRAEWARCARETYTDLEPWEAVVVARHPNRPSILDFIRHAVDDFCELHGDRYFGDDSAIVAGFGHVGDHRVMLIGHNRGREAAERAACRFGCARPEGYRKALAKMQLAAKFGVPIVTLIDTPGAYPGAESEERGIARAIAANLSAMPRLRVPIVAVVTGEGGSGGALGIGVADRLAMFEHSVYSVISPEGCASILFRTGTMAREAAASLKLLASDLREMGLVDEILPEPLGGAHRNHAETAQTWRAFVIRTVNELIGLGADQLIARRHERLRFVDSSRVSPIP